MLHLSGRPGPELRRLTGSLSSMLSLPGVRSSQHIFGSHSAVYRPQYAMHYVESEVLACPRHCEVQAAASTSTDPTGIGSRVEVESQGIGLPGMVESEGTELQGMV